MTHSMSLISQIESILFVAGKPLTAKKMAKVLNTKETDVAAALQELALKYNGEESGVSLLHTNEEWQLVSSPENKDVTEQFVKAEISGELTRPQLETLTVISYCGPITKPEMEQIRGVNCSLILRNLLMRGLVKENEDVTNLLPTYEVTMEYLRHLGLKSLAELPDYNELHKHEYITNVLSENPKI
jgi:segregation and condensation protein B